MFLHNSMPSMTGIITSDTIRSISSAPNMSSASLPLVAVRIIYSVSKSRTIRFIKSTLSSTNNKVYFLFSDVSSLSTMSSSCNKGISITTSFCCPDVSEAEITSPPSISSPKYAEHSAGISTQKDVPFPSSLSTVMVP